MKKTLLFMALFFAFLVLSAGILVNNALAGTDPSHSVCTIDAIDVNGFHGYGCNAGIWPVDAADKHSFYVQARCGGDEKKFFVQGQTYEKMKVLYAQVLAGFLGRKMVTFYSTTALPDAGDCAGFTVYVTPSVSLQNIDAD